jgi:hypothetical protein
MSTAGPQGIDQIRRVVAPAACANAAVDAGIQAFANGLDGVVTLLAPAIQPVDRTIHQTAGLVRGFQEPVTTCAP